MTTPAAILRADLPRVRADLPSARAANTPCGSKWVRGRTEREIAALIRADLKAELPWLKVSVRSTGGRTSSSITVMILGASKPLQITNPDRMRLELRGHGPVRCDGVLVPLRTVEAMALEHQIEQIAGAYNFDECRSEEDYYHVDFYFSVYFGGDFERLDRERTTASVKAALGL